MTKRLLAGTGVALAAAALIAARAAVAASSASPHAAAVTVAIPASAGAAVVYLGLQEQIFERAGVRLKVLPVSSSANALASVDAGKADLGLSETGALLEHAAANASSHLQIVAGASTTKRGYFGLVARSGGGVTKPSDLYDKHVGVSALGSLPEIGVLLWIDSNGGDSSALSFEPVAPKAMAGALAGGNVDLALAEQPLVATIAHGNRSLGDPVTAQLGAGVNTSVFFAQSSFLARHAGVASAFVKAVAQATAAARRDPAAVRALMARAANWPAAAAKTALLPGFSAAIQVDPLSQTAEAMLNFGITDVAPDMATLVWHGAPTA